MGVFSGMGKFLFSQVFTQAIKKNKPVLHEEYSPVLNKWFASRVFPRKNGLTIFSQEITSRKVSEAAYAKSEKLYRSIFESHPDAVFITDRHGTIQNNNEVAARKFNTSSGKLAGNNILSYLSAESRSKMSCSGMW